MTTEIKNSKKWYIVQVVTGYEYKVKEDLENRDFESNVIEEIFLPEKVSLTKAGKRKAKPMFPGYLYVKVDMTDESWFIIRNTNYVTGIVGSSGQRTKPTPVRETEIDRIKAKAVEEELKISNLTSNKDKVAITDTNYAEGDVVRIKEGEFANNEGKVTNISIETQKVSVEIEFFGRMTVVELALDAVEKK